MKYNANSVKLNGKTYIRKLIFFPAIYLFFSKQKIA